MNTQIRILQEADAAVYQLIRRRIVLEIGVDIGARNDARIYTSL